MTTFKINGLLPNFETETFQAVQLTVHNRLIDRIAPLSPGEQGQATHLPYLLPGFIDSHVHIESSMLVPSEFARLAVVHGTVATVSDPHEIANVCGLDGVKYMMDNGDQVRFKFFFGAPSCVPATHFETAGASIDSADVAILLQDERVKYLSEMMNYPGVLQHDREVMAKIAAAKHLGKPIDGHAPGLMGSDAKKYVEAGITTDHECYSMAEALNKLGLGMKILIREGSAAKNFDALIDLLHDFPDMIMFCSDDKHPDSLVEGHINQLCARAVNKGIDIFKILKATSINPILHYHLPVGRLRLGDPADFIVVKDLTSFAILQTYIDGILVADKGTTKIESIPAQPINQFNIGRKNLDDFRYKASGPAKGDHNIAIIEALDGQLITNRIIYPYQKLQRGSDDLSSNLADDVLKIVVVNRYQEAPIAKAFVKNFGLQRGAIASSVAHDSHNIVAVGVDDQSICEAVNLVIAQRGGISFYDATSPESHLGQANVLPLPVAGLMSTNDGYDVAKAYTHIDQLAKRAGSSLTSPFMTLSFMALLVIPHLKLSDQGLFDADTFSLIPS
jgi:adenine deaminase